MMVGRPTFGVERRDGCPAASRRRRCCASGACARPAPGLPALPDVSLDVGAGEILGVAGVSGNGQTELVEVLCRACAARPAGPVPSTTSSWRAPTPRG